MKRKSIKIDEVILHVGLHKTGTTSIQQTLFSDENNKLLENKNYIYPKCWYSNHSAPVHSAFCDFPEEYHINIRKGYSIQEIKSINEKNLNRFKKEIAEKEQSKLIISGEGISKLSFGNLNVLKEYLTSVFTSEVKIKVLIYVRNPVSCYVSTIHQKIKGGETY